MEQKGLDEDKKTERAKEIPVKMSDMKIPSTSQEPKEIKTH